MKWFEPRHPQKKPSLLAGLFYGAGDEARTRYLHLGKVALYRMSYTRGTRLIIAEEVKMSRTFSVWAVFLLKPPPGGGGKRFLYSSETGISPAVPHAGKAE